MHAVAFAFAALAAAASSAASSVPLAARQLDPSTFPAACQSTCNGVLGTINACTDVACMCTTSNDQALAACVDCILGSDGTTPQPSLVAQAQSILDNFQNTCAQGGASVPALTASPSYLSGTATTAPAPSSPSITFSSASAPVTRTPTTPTTSQQITFVGSNSNSNAPGTGTAAAASASTTDPFAKSGASRSGAGAIGMGVVVLGGLAVLL